jgi:hypothetical protein
VPEQHLDGANVSAQIQQVSREGMPLMPSSALPAFLRDPPRIDVRGVTKLIIEDLGHPSASYCSPPARPGLASSPVKRRRVPRLRSAHRLRLRMYPAKLGG